MLGVRAWDRGRKRGVVWSHAFFVCTSCSVMMSQRSLGCLLSPWKMMAKSFCTFEACQLCSIHVLPVIGTGGYRGQMECYSLAIALTLCAFSWGLPHLSVRHCWNICVKACEVAVVIPPYPPPGKLSQAPPMDSWKRNPHKLQQPLDPKGRGMGGTMS